MPREQDLTQHQSTIVLSQPPGSTFLAPLREGGSTLPAPLLDGGEGKTLTIKQTFTHSKPVPKQRTNLTKSHGASAWLEPDVSQHNLVPEPRPKLSKSHGASALLEPDVSPNKATESHTAECYTLSQLPTDRTSVPDMPGGSSFMDGTTSSLTLDSVGTEHLLPPRLTTGAKVTGASAEALRKLNRHVRYTLKADQHEDVKWWTTHHGQFELPPPRDQLGSHRNNMCPTGLALHHPAAPLLSTYATLGCPTQTGKQWTVTEMQAAIDRGPHISALDPAAIAQINTEVAEKVANGQARIVAWDDIQQNPPPELKISPLAMIPHKSRKFRAILDLSFPVKLDDGTIVPSVNDTTTKTAPRGAINQIGHSLQRIIHAFATADPDAKIFMAKWDIKDGFWRLDCEQGQEWNFCYVLPSLATEAVRLVVPTSLQMGWIESPPYFCTASETARDVAELYLQRPLNALPDHKFLAQTQQHSEQHTLPQTAFEPLKFVLEVYMDDFIGLAIPSSLSQLRHYSNAVMYGIHDVFPPDTTDDANDPISLRKLDKLDGSWAIVKDILGLTFNGVDKTIWLEENKRDALLTILSGWLRSGRDKNFGIPFQEFQSVIAKVRHAFITIPAGRGLMSPFNKLLRLQPTRVFLHRNKTVRTALSECRTFLRESISTPTKCISLVSAWPDYVGITDASSFGAGGIILGENKATPLTVFRVQWPQDITDAVVSATNPKGKLTNNDLEMAGLLLLWLAMEETCEDLQGCHVTLFSDNTPTVSWVQRMAAKHSDVAMQLLRVLALRMQIRRTSPLTPLHIAGIDNEMADIASRSFGSEPKWLCTTDTELTNMFTSLFPPPPQTSWNVFQHSSVITTRVISALRMQVFSTAEWRRLPQKGTFCGPIGPITSDLWDWTLSCKKHHTLHKSEQSRDLPAEFERDTMGGAAKLLLRRSLRQSQPLARRLPWPRDSTQPK